MNDKTPMELADGTKEGARAAYFKLATLGLEGLSVMAITPWMLNGLKSQVVV